VVIVESTFIEEKRDFSLRRPTTLQEQGWKRKLACFVRNDGVVAGASKNENRGGQ
jgi:hypothetical protein